MARGFCRANIGRTVVAIRATGSRAEPAAKVLYSLASSATKDLPTFPELKAVLSPVNHFFVCFLQHLLEEGIAPNEVAVDQGGECGQAGRDSRRCI